MSQRWSVEQVAAAAPSPKSVIAAEPLAVASRWSALGCDGRALWGRCRGSGAEPYETLVDHVEAAWACSCPSRKLPCKHALALLLMWVRGTVPEAARPRTAAAWIDARGRRSQSEAPAPGSTPPPPGSEPAPDREEPRGDSEADRERERARDERIARMLEGLVELERWLEDRMRAGLADPSLARYSTWDGLAARLVDARAGALANRVRRLAGLVGSTPEWHAEVLAELGMLHLIARAGMRLPDLPGGLADAVATVAGWQVRQADVLAGVPETDAWTVMGRSDTREDRIEVRRTWLRGVRSGRWAMLLSFAAYRQSLDTSWIVGTTVEADLFRYPGGSLRCLAGTRHADPSMLSDAVGGNVAEACAAVGTMLAAEPWLERLPATLVAAPTLSGGRWLVTDLTGALPLLGDAPAIATVVAASEARPVPLTVEWTPRGLVPLTVHLPDRTLDIGPRADPGFVSAA